MSKRILLTEAGSYSVELGSILTESAMVNGADRIFSCPCYPLDTLTGNNRIYPSSEMVPAARTLTEAAKSGSSSFPCTADGHPPEEFPEPTRASHKVLESWAQSGHLWIKFKVLETSAGRDLLSLIQEGDKLGISIRGLGALNGNCVTDYTLLGADFVAIPSTNLKVLPTRSSNIVSENLQSPIKNINSNHKGQKLNNITIKELQASLRESMEEIRSTTSKLDRQSLLNLAEQSLVGVSTLNCDTKYGLRDLFKLGAEWQKFKESLEPEQMKETVENTDANSNSDKNIPTGKDNSYSSDAEPVTVGKEIKIDGIVTDVDKSDGTLNVESEEYVENLENGLDLVEENLRNLSNENHVLREELISSINRVNLLDRAYGNIKNLKESATKDLMKEQLKNSQLRSIQESRERFYKSKANSTTGVNVKLVEDNVNLIKENQNLAKSAAAYRVTAEQLAEINLKLVTKVSK